MPRRTIQNKDRTVIISGEYDKSKVDTIWEALPSQEKVLLCPAKYLLAGGARGGGKSEAGRVFMVKGNQAFGLPEYDRNGEPILVNISYIYHPAYTGLVIRKNAKDHLNWIEEAKRLYGDLEGEYNKSEMRFLFPSGAAIYVGHLAEDDSWEKYQGHEYTRINIEEVGQLPDERALTLLLTSLRTKKKHPELKPQVFLSANPIGHLLTYLKQNYVQVNDDAGNRIPWETIFYEKRLPNGRKSVITLPPDPKLVVKANEEYITRCFIPMRLKDNIHLMPDYVAQFDDLSEAERAALLDGDWDAMTGGRYFESFREKPLTNEPEEACHVTDSVYLADWWDRWAGLDWGYAHETACYWACQNEDDKRIHIYREFVESQLEPFELGVKLAKLFEPDLLGLQSQMMPLYISKDTFDQRRGSSDPTTAELIGAGIKDYFGPMGCFVPHHTDQDDMQAFFDSGRKLQPRVVLQKVDTSPGSRILAAQYIRSLLRWRPAKPIQDTQFDEKLALQILKTQGVEAYRKYTDRAQETEEEVLPKLKIWRCCPKLIEQIPMIQYDDGGEDYDTKKGKWDRYDAMRYCLYNHTIQKGSRIPREVWIDRYIKERSGGGPMGWQKEHWLRQAAESAWGKTFSAGGKAPMPSTRRSRRG